jgi:hypothetical protein
VEAEFRAQFLVNATALRKAPLLQSALFFNSHYAHSHSEPEHLFASSILSHQAYIL